MFQLFRAATVLGKCAMVANQMLAQTLDDTTFRTESASPGNLSSHIPVWEYRLRYGLTEYSQDAGSATSSRHIVSNAVVYNAAVVSRTLREG